MGLNRSSAGILPEKQWCIENIDKHLTLGFFNGNGQWLNAVFYF